MNVLIFALISLLGSLVYVAVVAALHVLPTGYKPARNAVSDYGVGQYAPLFRVSLWAGSRAVAALPVGLALGLLNWLSGATLVGLILVVATLLPNAWLVLVALQLAVKAA